MHIDIVSTQVWVSGPGCQDVCESCKMQRSFPYPMYDLCYAVSPYHARTLLPLATMWAEAYMYTFTQINSQWKKLSYQASVSFALMIHDTRSST